MDGAGDPPTPLKALWRSASWSGRSSPAPPGRPPKPSRPLQPLSITRNDGPITGWPNAASDDCGHPPRTPSSSSSASDLECSRISDHVFLGSEAAARDRDALRRHGITHVLNCVGGACPDYFRGDLVYKTLWLQDSAAEDITSVLYDAFDYLEDVRAADPPARALVHCRRGASRSAAIVIAYLMWRHAQPFDDALRAVRAARAAADPNLGFASQLLQCQTRVLSPSSSGLRAYRLAPHSHFDPLHLVPKTISCPAHLDSRGAFIFHAPTAVMVWLGRECAPTMAEAAAAAARQVVRYERARGPILNFNEGSEPPDFWNENISVEGEVGKRRVELYDQDFEIFHRALEGREERNDEEDAEQSTTASSLSADTASIPSTFSPASTSSSDGCSSSPSPSPLVELHKDLSSINVSSKLPPLRPRKGKEKDPSAAGPLGSLACRRSGSAPSLVLLLASDRTNSHSLGDVVRDWCLSPIASDVEKCHNSLELMRLGSTEVEEDVSTSECNWLSHPLLFQWPGMVKVEEIHQGALDSSSVFMLLAPDSESRRREKSAVLYLWLGRSSPMILDTLSESSKETGGNSSADWDKITTEFLGQIGLPGDVAVQIVKEGEEPEQFFDLLFSIHQRINSSHESVQAIAKDKALTHVEVFDHKYKFRGRRSTSMIDPKFIFWDFTIRMQLDVKTWKKIVLELITGRAYGFTLRDSCIELN